MKSSHARLTGSSSTAFDAFKGDDGGSFFEPTVSRRIKQLPGFAGLTTISDTIAGISLDNAA